jgi:hypothetical protein
LRVYNKYVVSLTVVTCLITTILAFMVERDITVYFTVSVIAYLVITLLYVYFNPRARRALNTVAVVFFAGFLVIVAMKVVEILSV